MVKWHSAKCSRCGELYRSCHPLTQTVRKGEERLCPRCTDKLVKGV